jgi:hypothetical protein
MMTPQDTETLLRWNEKISKDIHITLLLSDDKDRSDALSDFCDTLVSLVPRFVIQKEKGEGEQVPAIKINDRLRYQAVPLGPELAPFMEAILLQETFSQNLSEQIHDALMKLRVPTILKLYIAPQCPFCPNAVRTLVPLTSASEHVYLSSIDGTMFTEISAADHIQSAPTVALDEFRWTGSFHLEEVVDIIVSRDPAQLSPSTIRNLIQEGSASQVAQLMLENHVIFPGFIDLLTDDKWSVRLGAMVSFEEIIENDPDLASQVISPLWKQLHSLEDQTKGDMIYLIGEAGTPDTIPRLQLLSDELFSDELKTIVQEAIESISERCEESGS